MSLIRAVHLAALMLLVGGPMFLLFVAQPAFRHAAEDARATLDAVVRWVLRLSGWALLVALISGLLWFGLIAASMSGLPLRQALTPRILGTVLFDTHFGHVWGLRLVLAGVLAGLLLVQRKRSAVGGSRTLLWLARALLACALLAALAWIGHAAATDGKGRFLDVAADAIHLLAAGIWLGGLVPLAFVLARLTRQGDAFTPGIAGAVLGRFSILGLVSVGSLVVTGVCNAWLLVGSLPALTRSPYGQLLQIKLALFLVMLGLAAANRLRLMPALARTGTNTEARRPGILRRVQRNAIAELCLGAAILLVVGTLGVTPPARHVMHMTQAPSGLSSHAIPGRHGSRDAPRRRDLG
jgi:copper resistance protein D